jgi:hypothetical protein
MNRLRVIPLASPRVGGISFTIARTDDEEAAVRERAAAQGLLAGAAMPTRPNPAVWSVLSALKKR